MATGLKPYEVTQQLEVAEKNGKRFVDKEDRFKRRTIFRNERINEVGGLKPFWIVMAFVGIPLAIVFGIYEALMAQSAIVSFIDPYGEGLVNPLLIQLIGAGLALFAMFMGHIFTEGLYGEKHPVTGRSTRRLGFPFFFSILGLLGYIFFQYKLVMAAGKEDADFNSFAMVAIGVACFEILVGVLILGKAITYILIFIAAIQLWLLHNGMNNTSEKTNNGYRDYTILLDRWNQEKPTSAMSREGNNNIRRAIMYYTGSNTQNQTKPEMEEELNNITEEEDDKNIDSVDFNNDTKL